jgi:hypothetical protein
MAMDYDAYDALLHHIFKQVPVDLFHTVIGSTHKFQQTQGDAWFKPSEENISAGVCLRVEPGHFRVFPYENSYLAPFEAAIRLLNPVVAVKVRSAAVHAALSIVYVVSRQFRSLSNGPHSVIIAPKMHLPSM